MRNSRSRFVIVTMLALVSIMSFSLSALAGVKATAETAEDPRVSTSCEPGRMYWDIEFINDGSQIWRDIQVCAKKDANVWVRYIDDGGNVEATKIPVSAGKTILTKKDMNWYGRSYAIYKLEVKREGNIIVDRVPDLRNW